MELKINRKDGSTIWIKNTVVPMLCPGGDLFGIRETTRDATDFEQMEERERTSGLNCVGQDRGVIKPQSGLQGALEKIGRMEEQMEGLYEQGKLLQLEKEAEVNRRIDFVRALVHELKTPLTSVIASGELLASELPEGPLLRLADNLNKGAHHLNRRIDELLDLAKGELGMLCLKQRHMDLLQLLHDVVAEVTPMATTNGQTLVWADVPSSLPTVWADEERLRQILLILLTNACKWTPSGERIILRVSNGGNFVKVGVWDAGPERADDELERLFEPYYQAEHDRQCISGLGLGLALCRILMELHGGKIWAESDRRKGSVFRFSVPLEINAGAEESIESGATP